MTRAIVTSTFRVGQRKCTMRTMSDGMVLTEWSPDTPVALSEKEADEYEAGCNELFQMTAEILGPVTVEAEPWLNVTQSTRG